MKHDHPQNPSALEKLRSAKLSVTPSRLAILDLLTGSQCVWSIEQIQEALNKRSLKAGKGSSVFTTLYRCLLKLESAGLVRKTDLGDGISRFELNSQENHHHHHVICKKCRSIEPLDECHSKRIENQIRKLGYTDVSHRLEFFGICKKCN